MQGCELCGREDLIGDLDVVSEEIEGLGLVIAVVEPAKRNWICCDSCNAIICHRCCSYPKSGYCDRCIARYRLDDFVKEMEGSR